MKSDAEKASGSKIELKRLNINDLPPPIRKSEITKIVRRFLPNKTRKITKKKGYDSFDKKKSLLGASEALILLHRRSLVLYTVSRLV